MGEKTQNKEDNKLQDNQQPTTDTATTAFVWRSKRTRMMEADRSGICDAQLGYFSPGFIMVSSLEEVGSKDTFHQILGFGRSAKHLQHLVEEMNQHPPQPPVVLAPPGLGIRGEIPPTLFFSTYHAFQHY